MADRRRTSQRPSRSCSACKRRKVKCDQRQPCGPCINHGVADRCKLETVELSTQWTKSRGELDFLLRLQSALLGSSAERARSDSLSLVEERLSLLRTGHPSRPAASTSAINVPTEAAGVGSFAYGERSSTPDDQHDDTLDTAIVLMRMGRGYSSADMATALTRNVPEATVAGWPDMLPSPIQAQQLVLFYLDHLSWHHHVLYSVEFAAQSGAFSSTQGTVSTQWLSLFFAVLGVSGGQLSEEYTTDNKNTKASAWNLPVEISQQLFNKEHLRDEAASWYGQAMALLVRADYMANHSIVAVQSVIISAMVAHPLGHGARHTIHLAACLRIAQCLGLAENKPSSTREEAEVCGRVWWQLLVQDYFLVPMAGSYMALLMPQLVDGLRPTTAVTQTAAAQLRHIQHIDALMRDLVTDLPQFLRPLRAHEEEDPSWPSWLRAARSALTVSAADKVIMIHRSHLVKSFQEDPSSSAPTYSLTRQTCVRAATTILREFLRVRNTNFVKLWVIPTFTVSAAVVIYLELLCRKKRGELNTMQGQTESEQYHHLRLLQDAISGLRELDYDENARRGVGMLEHLVDLLVLPSFEEHNDGKAKDEDTDQLAGGTRGASDEDLVAFLLDGVAWVS
ncbi:uncharacterized protein B0I36DRAFT_384554 [Microdochium trichocladiopsis]|uniref:Zn(2)-C6 fungal-type domain-containing protein n=1 Tax=Microdochium trichocladiopsis TaxID=1682393 RepID=A0A9P9BSK2_9PEZI|nr:uncharacterized protein B0I36DRAFT_384554 [Microdochium trichocladiopsis]KAH7028931.1 hypothetical protein B0I36DRAFT_384554 [Microdochium trichocladiopsis]